VYPDLLRRKVCFTVALVLLWCHPLAAQTDAIVQALRGRQFTAALELCAKDLKAQPANAQLWLYQGIALQELGRTKEALNSFRQASRLAPKLLPALEGSAQIEYRTGDPNCRHTLEQIVALRPDSAPAHGMLGVLAYEQKNCAEAVRQFESSGPQLNKNDAALWQFGNCLYRLRRPEEAAEKFTLLVALRNSDPVRYNLGLALLESKKPDQAVDVLRPLAAPQRPDSEVLGLLAAAYEAAKRTPDALNVLRRAAELYPREERHYIDFASICMEHSSLELGIEVLEVGVKNIPNSARLHATLGALLVRAGMPERGFEEFQRAQEMDPKAAYGDVGMSLALLQSDQLDESIGILRTQWARSQTSPMISFMLAEALLRVGPEPGKPAFEEAQSLLKKTVVLDPNHARAHGLLGKNYALAGNVPNAIKELETALRLDPGDRTSAYQLVLLYGKTGQKELSARWQQRVRELIQSDRIAETEGDRYRILKAAPERSLQ
jgi:tetratricopeptide (TPR) repeat protein